MLGPSGEELSMLDGNNNWQRTNVYAGAKLIGTYDTSGLDFQIEDPLGTRRVQVSGNPNYVGQPETDIQSFAYGDELFSFPDANAPPRRTMRRLFTSPAKNATPRVGMITFLAGGPHLTLGAPYLEEMWEGATV